ncbi:methyltransferase DDB_G0268948 isoform X1, partial [Pelobates cultripes]
MAAELFKNQDVSEVYHKYMTPVSSKVVDLILTYVEHKMGKPFKLAVDVGCGTGNSTRKLAAHFQEVIGADSSESQLNVARSCTSEKNTTYILSSSENLPLEDNSVDVINASFAVHWFDVEKFMQEAARVLKPGGCLALNSCLLKNEVHYKDISETLTNIFNENRNSVTHRSTETGAVHVQ